MSITSESRNLLVDLTQWYLMTHENAQLKSIKLLLIIVDGVDIAGSRSLRLVRLDGSRVYRNHEEVLSQ